MKNAFVTLPLLMLVTIGFVIGLVISPIWCGMQMANEMIENMMDRASKERREREAAKHS